MNASICWKRCPRWVFISDPGGSGCVSGQATGRVAHKVRCMDRQHDVDVGDPGRERQDGGLSCPTAEKRSPGTLTQVVKPGMSAHTLAGVVGSGEALLETEGHIRMAACGVLRAISAFIERFSNNAVSTLRG